MELQSGRSENTKGMPVGWLMFRKPRIRKGR